MAWFYKLPPKSPNRMLQGQFRIYSGSPNIIDYYRKSMYIYTNFYCRNTLFRWVLQGISGEAAFFLTFSDPTRRDPAPGRNPFLREKMQPGEDATAITGVITLPETNSSFMEIPHRNPGKYHQNVGFSRKLCFLQECMYNQTKTMHYYMGNGTLKNYHTLVLFDSPQNGTFNDP